MTKIKHFIHHKITFLIAASIAILVISLLVGMSLDKFGPIKFIDKHSYELIRIFPHNKFLDTLIYPFNKNFLPIFRPHPSFLVVMYGAFLSYIFFFKRKLFVWAVIVLIIATIISRIILKIDTEIFFRERPYEHLPNNVAQQVKESLKTWTSFPSGHSRDVAMYATLIAIFIKNKFVSIFLFVIVIFVGFSRLYLGVHYLSDVISGIMIGVSIGYISIEIMREIQIYFTKNKLV